MSINTNFMNMMNFPQFSGKQNYQNQNYNDTLCPNMYIGILNNNNMSS